MAAKELDKHLTIFFGVVDSSKDTLLYANAGQFPWPLVFDGTRTPRSNSRACPSGCWRPRATRAPLELPKDLVLAAFSDGLLEILPHATVAGKQRFLRRCSPGPT